MSTAHDLPVPYGDPLPALRLVPVEPLDFDESVRRIRPRLHRFAIRRLGDVHEAEELVQEALLRAYGHRHQLLTEDDLAAWTTVVTGRLVIDRLRVRGRSTSMADVPETGRVGRDTADVVVARDEARLALDALDAMPTRQAALLWAREVEGQSYEQLCARFRMTEPAVRSVLTRARKALRKEYGARGGTLPVGGLAVLAPWITGLSWADKVRHAATRLTAPASLSVLALTALGSLVLSPFSLFPGHEATFRPTTSVVSTPEPDALPHIPTFGPASMTVHPSRPHQAGGPAGSQVAALVHVVKRQVPCVNDADSSGTHPTVAVPDVTAPGDPTAGPDSCAKARTTPGSTLWVNATLPANPTGMTQVSVTSNKIDCAYVPDNPLVECTPATPGATP